MLSRYFFPYKTHSICANTMCAEGQRWGFGPNLNAALVIHIRCTVKDKILGA